MAEQDADVRKIKELIEIMKDNDLVRIDIKHGDDRIALRRAQPPQPGHMTGPFIASLPGGTMPMNAPLNTIEGQSQGPSVQRDENLLEITSPIVGTFYEGPSPDSDPYVDVGSHVNPQTVVCIIEAMKVMNEIKSEVSGTVVERCISNGQAVEYGQVLFRVQKG